MAPGQRAFRDFASQEVEACDLEEGLFERETRLPWGFVARKGWLFVVVQEDAQHGQNRSHQSLDQPHFEVQAQPWEW